MLHYLTISIFFYIVFLDINYFFSNSWYMKIVLEGRKIILVLHKS